MRLFSNKHLWVELADNIAIVGISNYAQEKLGSIMFVNLPDLGDQLEEGKKFGDIESIKNVSDLFSPISGKITEVNDDVVDEPDKLNEDPYENWMIKAECLGVPDTLISEKEYEAHKEEF